MPRPYPEGWFRIAAAGELPRRAVLPLTAFGQELVLFRTELGRIAAVDAHCPHAGAHLGHGGTVEGEALRCPFHGLRYQGDGRCLEDGRQRASLGSWPVEIWQGQVMVYHSADRRAPDWRLPSLPRGEWLLPRWRTLRLRGHVQDVAENGVDFSHFVHVHRYSNLRQPHIDVDGWRLHSRFGFERANPLWKRLGNVAAVFDTDMWGLGCSITDLHVADGRLHFRLLLLATQIDAEEFSFSIGIAFERPQWARRAARTLFDAASPGVVAFLHKSVLSDVLQDREIWAHRQWLPRQALTSADAPLATFHRYVQRFYPRPAVA